MNDQLQLEATENLAKIEVVDIRGRRVLLQDGTSTNRIDVSQLTNGTYVIVWSTNGEGTAKRFLKL